MPSHLAKKEINDLENQEKLQNLNSLFDGKMKYIVLIAGLFIFESVLSLWTGHPYDMKIWFDTGVWINKGTNIYLPANHIGYPPLWALWCGVATIFYNFFGSLEIWRFIVKLPLIIGHLALAFVVAKFAESRFGLKTAQKIFLIILGWSFFIYSGAMWGQINVLSALLTFLAFYALTENRTATSALLLGLAITLKIYPIVTLPVFLIYILKNRDKKTTAKFAFLACAPPVLFTFAIFAIYQWDITYFLRTIFYSTPIFESEPSQFNVGCMNVWSFIALQGISTGPLWLLRQLWIPILATGGVYWLKKPKLTEKDFVLALTTFYILFMVSYGWISEQTLVDLLPFLFLIVLAYKPKRAYFYLLLLVQFLVYIFSFANQSLALFEPLAQSLSPSIITDAQDFAFDNGQLIWTIRGTMGLIVSISLIVSLVLLIKPEILKHIQEKLGRFLKVHKL
jgi:Gpi18-like mannosyltransferase